MVVRSREIVEEEVLFVFVAFLGGYARFFAAVRLSRYSSSFVASLVEHGCPSRGVSTPELEVPFFVADS